MEKQKTQLMRWLIAICMFVFALGWANATKHTPTGPVQFNSLAATIADGDTIALLSPSDLAADSTYKLTATFGIDGKDITICPANVANGMPYINGANNTIQFKNASITVDNIEYYGGKYFIQVTGAADSIKITNCKFDKISRGIIVGGGNPVQKAIVDNCIISNSGGGDNNPLLGSSSTSGFFKYFQLSNSTLSAIKTPVIRITTKTKDAMNIVVDHCTMDSLVKNGVSPFFLTKNFTDTIVSSKITISNNVISNVIGCSSLWERCTLVDSAAEAVVEATTVWNAGDVSDLTESSVVTLAASYKNLDPMYLKYFGAITSTKDLTVTNKELFNAATDGGVIGNSNYTHFKIWIPTGPVALNKLKDSISNGDIIELLSPSDLAVDSTYKLTATFGIDGKDIIIRPANIANGMPYINGANNTIQFKNASISVNNIEYYGGKYFIQVTGAAESIKITNCKFEKIARGIIVGGGNPIQSAIVDNCIIYNSGGGDNNPLLGSSSTSGFFNYFQLSNCTMSAINTPIVRITTKTKSPMQIVIDHCTMDSLVKNGVSPFFITKNYDSIVGNEITISNCVITNVIGCSSIWDRITLAPSEKQVVEATTVWNVGDVSDLIASHKVTLASTYKGINPLYLNYSGNITSTKDLTIKDPRLLTLGTDGGVIGDPRWDTQFRIWTPIGPVTFINLKDSISSGDIIALLPPSDLAADSTYTLTANFAIDSKDISIVPANSNGMPYINGANNAIQFKKGSLTVDNIEYYGGKYFIQVTDTAESILVTNCKFDKISRGIVVAGGPPVNSVVVDNCIITNAGGGDQYPVVGSGSSGGFIKNYQLTNCTMSAVKAPIVRLITKTKTDSMNIVIDHCTIDSIYGGAASPFYFDDGNDTIVGSDIKISNCMISNVIGCTSLWARCTLTDKASTVIETTSVWNVGAATDSAASDTVTLASSYKNLNPQYADYTAIMATRDFEINNSELKSLSTDGGVIGDLRWFKSDDTTLYSLTYDGKAISLVAGQTKYDVVLVAGSTSTTVKAVANDFNAVVTGAGSVDVSSKTGADTIIVTAQAGNTGTYIVNFTVLKSTDATLSDLKVDGTTVTGFASATLSYDVGLAAGTTTVPTVTATTNYANAPAPVIAAATALPGSTTVTVTAEDDTTVLVYTINFTVGKSDDATLSDLKVDGTTVTGFASATLTYDVELAAGTTTVPTVTATANDAKASAPVIAAATALPGSTKITVTAEDGTTVKVYTVNFTVAVAPKSDDATLSDLKVDGTTVTGFASGTLTYNVELAAGTTTVPTVTATANDAKASAPVIAAATALPGATTVTVTAEDGTTVKVYTVNFTVAVAPKSDDATLSDLKVDGTTVTGFASGTLTYDVELAAGTTTVPTVTATANDANASAPVIVAATALPGSTTVTVTAEDGTTVKVYTINFTVLTAVDEFNSLSLKVYPNPANNNLVVENATEISLAYIYNSNGTLVKTLRNINTNAFNINISELNHGLYIINIVTVNHKLINTTFIKK